MDFKDKYNIPNQKDEVLKQIAKDIFNNLIFTDKHCSPNDLSSVFMCLLFMGPKTPDKPAHPSKNNTLDGKRDNTLFDLIDRENLEKKYEEDMKLYKKENEYYKEHYLPQIGMVYEYLKNAGPMSINGYPFFMSLRLLNKEDNAKVWEYYEAYKKLRESVDNF